jgi:uncharacterized protein (TIGR02217 family)
MAQNLQLPFASVRLYGDDIITGTAGGPEFSTDVSTNHGGFEQRNANWSVPLGRWDIGQRGYCQATKDYLLSFFRQRRGKFQCFLWRDIADWQATAIPLASEQGFTTQGLIVFGATGAGQLIKRYSDGTFMADRPIVNAIAASLTLPAGLSLNAQGQIDGATAALYNTELSVSFDFDVPVRFDVDKLNFTLQSTEAKPGTPDFEAIYYTDTLPIVEQRYNGQPITTAPALVFNSQFALSCNRVTESNTFYVTLVIAPNDPTGTYQIRAANGEVVTLYIPNADYPVQHTQGNASGSSSPNTNNTGASNFFQLEADADIGEVWTLEHVESGTVIASSSVPLCTITPAPLFSSQLALSCALVEQPGSFLMSLRINASDPTGTYAVRNASGALVDMYIPNVNHPIAHVQGNPNYINSPNTDTSSYDNFYLIGVDHSAGDIWTLTHEETGTLVANAAVPACSGTPADKPFVQMRAFCDSTPSNQGAFLLSMTYSDLSQLGDYVLVDSSNAPFSTLAALNLSNVGSSNTTVDSYEIAGWHNGDAFNTLQLPGNTVIGLKHVDTGLIVASIASIDYCE